MDKGEEEEFGYGSEIYDIISGIRDLLRESANITQNISTIMIELNAIRMKYKGEKISKGDYEITKGPIIEKGTIYMKSESALLKNLLDVKIEYWNPSWDFISWGELFSKMDKVNMVLEDLRIHKSEFEYILLESEEIKIRLDTISKYQLGPTKV